MKGIFKLVIVLLSSVFIFNFSACNDDIDVDDWQCEEYWTESIEVDFYPLLEIWYNDGERYEGPVDFSIHKVYCDEDISGVFTQNNHDVYNGTWLTGKYTYKFQDKNDLVTWAFVIHKEGSSEAESGEGTFYSDDLKDRIESKPDYDYKETPKVQITLPWNKQ